MRGGSVAAAKYLGDLYVRGEQVDKDDKQAMYYYKRAAKLGGEGDYETLGDIFHSDELTEPDYKIAYALYENGANAGDYNCQVKLKAMIEERERNYVLRCPCRAFRQNGGGIYS